MDISGLEDIFPPDDVNVFNHGRYEESIQPLQDLGYLKPIQTEGVIASEEEFRLAVKQWRKDVIASGLLLEEDLYSGSMDFSWPEDILSSQELKLLHELTGLDGSFLLQTEIFAGQQDLISRVVLYRLDILDLEEGLLVDMPLNQQILDTINLFKEWLGEKDIISVINYMGDVPKLTNIIKDHPFFWDRIAVFEFPANSHETQTKQSFTKKDEKGGRVPKGHNEQNAFSEEKEKYSHTQKANKRKFRRHLKDSMPQQSFKKLSSEVLKDPVNYQFLAQEAQNDINWFLLRLFQLNQWIHGYYLGKLDSDIGPVSFTSLAEICESEQKAGNTDFQPNHFILYVGNNYWLFNIHYFFKNSFLFQQQEDFTLDALVEATNDMMTGLNKKERKNVEQNLNKAWEEINKEANRNLRHPDGPFRRRVYLGVKSTVKAIRKSLTEIFDFLKKSSRQFMAAIRKHVFGRIKYMAKLLYHEIREGLKQYIKGMQFLFGKRVIDTEAAVTMFDFDGDGISLIKHEVLPEMLNLHAQTVKSYTESLNFALSLTSRVIRFVITVVGHLSWPMLLLRLGLIFKNFIKDKLGQQLKKAVPGIVRIAY